MFSTWKRCLIGSLMWGYQKFYSLPIDNGFLAQKRPNLAQNWHFWPNIGIFGLFDPVANQTMMQTSCLGVFFFGEKTDFWPKTANFGPKLAFLAKYWHFWPIWSNAWPKNDANKLSRWFCYPLTFTINQSWLFWPNIGIFGPFDPLSDQKQCEQGV